MRLSDKLGHHYEDSEADEIFKSLKFIYTKLNFLREQIKKEYVNFNQEILDFARKELSKRSILKSKKYGDEHEEIIKILSAESDHELFFYFETFIIDCKRMIIFSLKLLAKLDNVKIKDDSIEKLIRNLEKPNENSPYFCKHLLSKREEFADYILSEKKWLDGLNAKRTHMIHNKVFNKTDSVEISFKWGHNKNMRHRPEEEVSELTIFGRPILSVVDYNFDKCLEFVGNVLLLNKDLLVEERFI